MERYTMFINRRLSIHKTVNYLKSSINSKQIYVNPNTVIHNISNKDTVTLMCQNKSLRIAKTFLKKKYR